MKYDSLNWQKSIYREVGAFLMPIFERSVNAYGNLIRTVSVKG